MTLPKAAIMAALLPLACSAQDWTHSKVVDGFHDHELTVATLASQNLITTNKAGARAKATLQAYPQPDGSIGVTVIIPGAQIVCLSPCDIPTRFGSPQVMIFKAATPEDLSTDYINLKNGSLFMDWLSKRREVMMQLIIYQAGAQTIRFSAQTDPKLD